MGQAFLLGLLALGDIAADGEHASHFSMVVALHDDAYLMNNWLLVRDRQGDFDFSVLAAGEGSVHGLCVGFVTAIGIQFADARAEHACGVSAQSFFEHRVDVNGPSFPIVADDVVRQIFRQRAELMFARPQ